VGYRLPDYASSAVKVRACHTRKFQKRQFRIFRSRRSMGGATSCGDGRSVHSACVNVTPRVDPTTRKLDEETRMRIRTDPGTFAGLIAAAIAVAIIALLLLGGGVGKAPAADARLP
jgi:hypothetical protein